MIEAILNIILELKNQNVPIEKIIVSATDIMQLRTELKNALGSPNITEIRGVPVIESPDVRRGAFHLVMKY
jgi:hypothetical protein